MGERRDQSKPLEVPMLDFLTPFEPEIGDSDCRNCQIDFPKSGFGFLGAQNSLGDKRAVS